MFNPKKTVAHGEVFTFFYTKCRQTFTKVNLHWEQVRNQGFGGVLCLDANSLTVDGINSPAIVWPCHKHGGNQVATPLNQITLNILLN